MDLRWQLRDKSDEGLPSGSQNWVVLLEDGLAGRVSTLVLGLTWLRPSGLLGSAIS
jgi:hypothetical protein